MVERAHARRKNQDDRQSERWQQKRGGIVLVALKGNSDSRKKSVKGAVGGGRGTFRRTDTVEDRVGCRVKKRRGAAMVNLYRRIACALEITDGKGRATTI